LPSVEIAISGVSKVNKRHQVKTAIENAPRQGKKAPKVLVLADDDIRFPPYTYHWILDPFKNSQIGAVGTSQQTKRSEDEPFLMRLVAWLFVDYIERRNFENAATLKIDGGISCLSGRMLAVRATIVLSRKYLDGYISEKWNGIELYADDDNYLTRWLQENGWEIGFQYSTNCRVETSFDHSFKQLWKRCLRWARSNWRSNWKSIRQTDNWR
jgi:cellulose synthase/poly-beta-1,6-N-acetylglucosamine synthase-like glycosyltransferase